MGNQAAYCHQCKGIRKKKTFCKKCPFRVKIHPENKPVVKLWNFASNQYKMGFSLIGLDYPAIKLIAETLGIPFDELLLRQLQVLENFILHAAQEQSKPKNFTGNHVIRKNRHQRKRPNR